jgi:hypothetical protein
MRNVTPVNSIILKMRFNFGLNELKIVSMQEFLDETYVINK